jgi:N-acetylmuramoyl-L-alanine amidase
MLLDVRNTNRNKMRNGILMVAVLFFASFTGTAITYSSQSPVQAQPGQAPTQPAAPAQPGGAPPGVAAQAQAATPQHANLNIVVLDAAHGGTDPGARGTGGIRESEVVLEFAVQVRRALEAQGFQVVPTRKENENPSFDDRSVIANANAQRGGIFVTLHISSTGLASTARVYVNTDLPSGPDISGLIPWDRAQGPFLGLSRKLGDLVQGQLAQRFKGSPSVAQVAAVRQLRTTAAPAIAVEVSSVSVDDRNELDRMAPGVADAIARGVAAFRPTYVVANASGAQP